MAAFAAAESPGVFHARLQDIGIPLRATSNIPLYTPNTLILAKRVLMRVLVSGLVRGLILVLVRALVRVLVRVLDEVLLRAMV